MDFVGLGMWVGILAAVGIVSQASAFRIHEADVELASAFAQVHPECDACADAAARGPHRRVICT